MSTAIETDEFLEHYGVKGMKWGLRRGGLKSRIKGARLDQNQRRTAIATRAANGKSTLEERIVNKPTKILLGKEGYTRFAKNEVENLGAQKKRIETGKKTVMDVLETYNTLTMLDLVVSRQDNKG